MSSLFFKLFPTPALLKVPCVGLDLSGGILRAVEFSGHSDGRPGGVHTKIKRIGEAVLTPGILDSGYINDEQALGQELAAFAKKVGFTNAFVTLPEEKMYVFSLFIRATTHDEIRNAIEFQLEENVPIPPAEAIFEYRPLEWEGSVCTKVSVTVFPQKTVNAYLTAIEKSGIQVIGFMSEPQAIAEAVVPRGKYPASMVVHISEPKTSVIVVKHGVVRFSSTIPLGGKAINEALQKAFPLQGLNPKEEIIRLKKEISIDAVKAKEAFNATMSTFSAINDEVQKVYAYWRTHSKDTTDIHNIILSGHDALIPGLDSYLSSMTKTAVSVANVWGNTGVELPVAELERAEALDYAGAIGLALAQHI